MLKFDKIPDGAFAKYDFINTKPEPHIWYYPRNEKYKSFTPYYEDKAIFPNVSFLWRLRKRRLNWKPVQRLRANYKDPCNWYSAYDYRAMEFYSLCRNSRHQHDISIVDSPQLEWAIELECNKDTTIDDYKEKLKALQQSITEPIQSFKDGTFLISHRGDMHLPFAIDDDNWGMVISMNFGLVHFKDEYDHGEDTSSGLYKLFYMSVDDFVEEEKNSLAVRSIEQKVPLHQTVRSKLYRRNENKKHI